MAETQGLFLHFPRIMVLVTFLGAAGLHATTFNLTPSGDLQGTLNGSIAGDVINLAPGTYTMKTGEPYFHVDSGVTLQGTGGSGVTTIQPPSGAFYGLDVRNSNTTVKGVTISAGSFGVVIASPTNGTAISNITLFDVIANSVPSSSTNGNGITLSAASSVTIDTCNIGQAYANGISLSGASNNVIIRNTQVQGAITSNGITIQNSSGAQISNTTVKNVAAGNGILLQSAPGAQISGTNITNITVGSGVFLQTALGATLTGLTIGTVGQNGVYILDSNNVSVSSTTIANAAQSGILVQATGATPVQNASLTNDTITIAGAQGILLIGAINSTISSCTVVTAGANGIFVETGSTGVVIQNVIVKSAVQQGIAVQGNSGSAQILNTTISSATNGSGILLDGSPNSTVTGTTIGTVGQHGVYIKDSSNVSVSSTTVANATQSGVVSQTTTQPNVTGTSLTGNTITFAKLDGILLDGSLSAVINNCTVIQSGANGIHLINGSTGVTIQSAIIQTTGQQGIAVQNSGSANILNSSVSSALASTSNGIEVQFSPNSTIDSATIGTAGQHGIYVLDSDNAIVRNSTVASAGANGITVQAIHNSTVNSPLLYNNTITKAIFQGIEFSGVTHGTIDSCTVVHAAGGLNAGSSDGIFLDAGTCANQSCGSTGNLVINNKVIQADTHGLVNKNSTFNTWAGNTVLSTGFHGMELIGSSYNRVDRNNLSGFFVDGITLALGDDANQTPSVSNYIGKNTIVSNGNAAGRQNGTGIWMDQKANNTFVFGNSEFGDVEGGITSFNSSSSYIQANLISGNGEAGVLIWNQDPSFGNLQRTTIQNNYIFNNPSQGLMLMRGAQFNDMGFNFLSSPTLATQPGLDPGITLISWSGIGQANGTSTGPDTNSTIYRNTFLNLKTPLQVGADATSTLIFGNRFINSPDLYSIAPAAVNWDNEVYMGGNYYGSANPPAGTPYTNFIVDTIGHRGNIDRYPLPNEAFGLAYSISIEEPVAGLVAATGSQKTITWQSTGCFLVDISYRSPTTGATAFIAQGWPDIGFYHWTVPAVAAAADYTIRVDCKNAGNTYIGLSATTSPFTIAPANLVLLSPGRELMANSNQPVRVSWARANGFSAPVNIYLSTSAGGGWTQVGASATGDTFDIPTSALTGVNSNHVSVLIQTTNAQDSTDGYFTLRGGTASAGTATFTNPGGAGPVSFAVKSAVDLEWISPQGSYLVTLDLWDATAGQFVNITTNLPDYGKYRWLVPELWITGGYIRATFLDSSGNVLSQTPLNSGLVNLRYTTTPGVLEPFFRLYSPVTKEHLYTTDNNEYNVLGTTGIWNQEGEIGQILTGPVNFNGVEATPYYRLYNLITQQHHWTTDRNEYFTLRGYSSWAPEGPIGYVFDSSHAVTGSAPLYRLVFNFPPNYHLWTLDVNEKNVLTSGPGWTYEEVAANIFCSTNNIIYSGCATSLPNLPATVRPPVSGGISFSSLSPIGNDQFGALTPNKPVLEAVLNGASFEPGPVAPGQTVTLLGQWLGPLVPAPAQFQSGVLGSTLGGVRVLVDGEAAPLLYASAGELKAIVPYDTAGKKSVQVQVEYQGGISALAVAIAASAPGIFTADQSGKGQAFALNDDNSLNSPMNSASQGSVVSLFSTGEGVTDPALMAGTVPTPDILPKPLLAVAVRIGGQLAEVVYAGAIAGSPGVMQLRVRIPTGIPVGPAIPVSVMVGSATSQSTATLALN